MTKHLLSITDCDAVFVKELFALVPHMRDIVKHG